MSGDVAVTCWKCGVSGISILLPLSRREECPHCNAELHVCRMCRLYDPSVSNACREPVAERVTDKTRANFCGYLELNPDVQSGVRGGAASDELNSLFGLDSPADSSDGTDALDALFGLNEKDN